MQLRWRLHHAPKRGRSRTNRLDVHLLLTAESPLLRVHVRGVNRARDHRLRLGVRTNILDPEVWADAAFGPVQRVQLDLPNNEARQERPPRTAPLHRYVSIFTTDRGATLYSDGLAEYEATEDGTLFVTLVRAVGALSRRHLPERPGHAGWPAPTPGAQSLRPFAARFALLLHGARDITAIDAIERMADDALLPLEGRTLRSALALPPNTPGVELEGRGLAFSTLKESEDGEWTVARCVNLLDETVQGTWRFGDPISECYTARLDETPVDRLATAGKAVPFRAPPRAIVTLLIR
jgi:alpha-mannosidase